MDAATLQTRINTGTGKAAQRVGYTFSLYRPVDPDTNPIVPWNLITTLPASFTITGTGFNFEKPMTYKSPLFNGLFDATLVDIGDYFVSPTHGTYFVAGMQDLAPPLCVLCNRTVSFVAPGPAKTFGAQAAYSGTTAANEQPVVTTWPASVLFDARGRTNEIALPLDLPSPFFSILIPALPGIDIRAGMVMNDDQSRRYVVAAAENSPLGWRISAQQAQT